jgi:hypothetical protein
VKDRRKIGISRRRRRKLREKKEKKGRGYRDAEEIMKRRRMKEKRRTQFAPEKIIDELNNMASPNVTMIK